MKKEIWKDIPEYEGIYQVSNLGNVKSLERKVWMKRNNCFKTLKERQMKISINNVGYYHVGLCKKSKAKTRTIHQLVAVSFLNHVPSGYALVVNHKNRIRTDNSVENLEIITTRENTNQKHLKSSSNHIGVQWHKGSKRWSAVIYINGKHNYLGYFRKEIDAANAYNNKLKEINHG